MYTKEQVKRIIMNSDCDTMVTDFSKSQLHEMYRAVYGRYPGMSLRKQDIARSIIRYFACIERALRLKP